MVSLLVAQRNIVSSGPGQSSVQHGEDGLAIGHSKTVMPARANQRVEDGKEVKRRLIFP